MNDAMPPDWFSWFTVPLPVGLVTTGLQVGGDCAHASPTVIDKTQSAIAGSLLGGIVGAQSNSGALLPIQVSARNIAEISRHKS